MWGTFPRLHEFDTGGDPIAESAFASFWTTGTTTESRAHTAMTLGMMGCVLVSSAGRRSAGEKLTILPGGQKYSKDSHYWVSALLGVALVPLLKRLNLPVAYDWPKLCSAYWLVLAAQSIFVATLLSLLAFPPDDPFRRLRQEVPRLSIVLVYFLVLWWTLTWVKALIVTVDAVAILEFFRRLKPPDLRKAAGSVLLPALYLFFGFLLVFAYNDIILSVRFFGATDATLFMMDQWLLHGFSVSSLCHWAVHSLPVSFFRVLELIYFGMFSQIGAALILTGLYDNKRRAFQFVGTILTAYYLALALFYLWPSQGPFYLCPTHFSVFPDQLQTYAFQKWSVANSQALWKHVRVRHISTDYYIALPCMHIAQPLVVAWFLRRWKRMLAVLAAYDVLLLAAIVLLEWHYVVDIIAGVLVACVAIAVVDGGELWSWIRSRPATVWVGKNGLSLE